jgi:hypothetical protein
VFVSSAVAAASAVNAIFHIGTTALFREYSPGVVTATSAVLPAALYTLHRTRRDGLLSDEQLVGAIAAGTALSAAVVGSLYLDMPRLGEGV